MFVLTIMSGTAENIAYFGASRTIEYAILESGKMPAREFFYGLRETEQRRLFVLFQLLGDTGQIKNRELFKKVEGTEFFEFKRAQVRVICYMEQDKRVVLTHGFLKKKQKIPPAEIERARMIKKRYILFRRS